MMSKKDFLGRVVEEVQVKNDPAMILVADLHEGYYNVNIEGKTQITFYKK